jgi:hypothetical protein
MACSSSAMALRRAMETIDVKTTGHDKDTHAFPTHKRSCWRYRLKGLGFHVSLPMAMVAWRGRAQWQEGVLVALVR